MEYGQGYTCTASTLPLTVLQWTVKVEKDLFRLFLIPTGLNRPSPLHGATWSFIPSFFAAIKVFHQEKKKRIFGSSWDADKRTARTARVCNRALDRKEGKKSRKGSLLGLVWFIIMYSIQEAVFCVYMCGRRPIERKSIRPPPSEKQLITSDIPTRGVSLPFFGNRIFSPPLFFSSSSSPSFASSHSWRKEDTMGKDPKREKGRLH